MKTTIVSFAIYSLIFVVLGAAVYFFAFWRPHNNRIEQLNNEIAAARVELVNAILRDELSPELTGDIERLNNELEQVRSNWEHVNSDWQHNYLNFLPEAFNELDMRERIYRIATPHSHSLSVYFLDSQPFGVMSHSSDNPYGPQEGIWITSATISFTATYDGLLAILSGFVYEGIDNRIVEYSLTRSNGDQWNIILRLDLLTLAPNVNISG